MTNTTTFDMEVVTSRTPQAFITALFERIDVEATAEEFDGITELRTQLFEITTFENARDATAAELGIEPNVFIEFRPKPSLDTDILAVRRLLQAVDRWLREIENDFVMVYNGESVMMYRKDCDLKINESSRGWTPARLSLITVDYETVDIPALRDATRDQ